jgi:hypothetical protein
MAQPVPLKLVRPHAAPDEHADAVQAAYALLDELHDAGVLDLLRGLAGAGAIAALRNAISLMKILGGIDPAILQGVANILTQPRRTLSAAAYGLQVFGRVLLSRW